MNRITIDKDKLNDDNLWMQIVKKMEEKNQSLEEASKDVPLAVKPKRSFSSHLYSPKQRRRVRIQHGK